MPRSDTWQKVKPGQFVVLIKQCAYPNCEEWFIGSPSARYCEEHKVVRARQLKTDWQRQYRDNGMVVHRSKLSWDQIMDIRDRFLRQPAREIAEEYGISVKTVYKYQKKTPKGLRRV